MGYRVDKLCQRRKLNTHDIVTPLLIPSFSSKGFPNLNDIWQYMNPYLPDVILLSCYDIHYGLIEYSDVANLIILDSGGYETNIDIDLSSVDQSVHRPNQWDKGKYLDTLRGITTLNTCVAVSYDNPSIPFINQIEIAREDLLGFVSVDFLLKPSNGTVINLDELENNVSVLFPFDLIGITEKELGRSLIERLRIVAQLRTILSEYGLDTPIHVFGCLDPISVWLYFLCGADVFDGLSWLRYSFWQNIALYRNSWAILTERLNLSDQDLLYESYLNNLDLLKSNQRAMIQFAENLNISLLPFDVDLITRTLSQAAVSWFGKE